MQCALQANSVTFSTHVGLTYSSSECTYLNIFKQFKVYKSCHICIYKPLHLQTDHSLQTMYIYACTYPSTFKTALCPEYRWNTALLTLKIIHHSIIRHWFTFHKNVATSISSNSSPHDDHRSSGPRPVKLFSVFF